jgi:hypothetical protein
VRIVEHYSGGPHKLLRVETDGCAVNIVIDLHDPHGIPFVAVEVEPRLPDGDGRIWEVEGSSTVLVHCRGLQVMQGDRAYAPERDTPPAQAPTELESSR